MEGLIQLLFEIFIGIFLVGMILLMCMGIALLIKVFIEYVQDEWL